MGLYHYAILPFFFLPFAGLTQINNCIGAQIICDGQDISLNPQGPGLNDYADPDNIAGCLIEFEHNTAWYYFEINENAPAGLILGFTINPNGGFGEDYDWALYGPDVACNDLGSPIRCSSSSAFCDFCPQTGMGMGTNDISEGPGSGDGFVKTLPVEPGQGFYLVIDNWQGSLNGFVLTWTGTAADHLNCDAEIPCKITVDAGPDILICGGNPSLVQLNSIITETDGNEIYAWTGTNGGTSFLNDPSVPDPEVQIPADFSGTIVFTLVVTEDICTRIDSLTITVPNPSVSIHPAGPFCKDGIPYTLMASPPGGEWGGAVDGNIFDPALFDQGNHVVTYTYKESNTPCMVSDSIIIKVLDRSGTTISLGPDISVALGANPVVAAMLNIPASEINSIIWDPSDLIGCLDPACIKVEVEALENLVITATVIDQHGCADKDDLQVTVNKERHISIPTIFSPNNDGINDLFFVSTDHRQIKRIKKFTIYNRWGSVVHEEQDFLAGDLTKAWDGLEKNNLLNPGVFLYVVEAEFIDGVTKRFTGDVTLIK